MHGVDIVKSIKRFVDIYTANKNINKAIDFLAGIHAKRELYADYADK
ncbi:MAG: hypothetical protein M1407_01605 [Deltaproteobacteria bacterium]|nr:hypothetical protein [Deltaproteobacteria bacterium]